MFLFGVLPLLALAGINFLLVRITDLIIDVPVFIPEADKAVQFGLVFLTFYGAGRAASRGEHLALDILHLFKGPWVGYLTRSAIIVAALFCFWVTAISYEFVVEISDPELDAFWGLSEKTTDFIYPIGFLLMGIRFLFAAIAGVESHAALEEK